MLTVVKSVQFAVLVAGKQHWDWTVVSDRWKVFRRLERYDQRRWWRRWQWFKQHLDPATRGVPTRLGLRPRSHRNVHRHRRQYSPSLENWFENKTCDF